MLTQEQIDFLFCKAYDAALRAGACILEIYNRSEELEVDLKKDNTPITEADRCSHELIKHYLGQTRIPLMSEEGRDLLYAERQGWDLFWLVDPLDGTKEFIKGNGEFTVNIALMHNNEPVIGIIYVPYIRRAYFAVKGFGAYLKTGVHPDPSSECSVEKVLEGARRLPLRDRANEPILIAVSRSHNTPETYDHIERIKKDHPMAQVMEQGSSYKLCLLAEALVDVYVRTSPTYEWDIAAGDIIIREAGGSLSALEGDERMAYNKPDLHNPHFIGKSRFF